MLEIMLALSAAVTAFTEFTKGALLQWAFFSGMDEQKQSVVLQGVAFLAGVIAVTNASVNLFPNAPESLGYVLTGTIVSLGSAGIHVVLALLGIRAGVTADRETTVGAQSIGTAMRRTYAPFM